MYDPSIGRWLEEDPLSFEAGDANLYRYTTNSPTNDTDPSGLKHWSGKGEWPRWNEIAKQYLPKSFVKYGESWFLSPKEVSSYDRLTFGGKAVVTYKQETVLVGAVSAGGASGAGGVGPLVGSVEVPLLPVICDVKVRGFGWRYFPKKDGHIFDNIQGEHVAFLVLEVQYSKRTLAGHPLPDSWEMYGWSLQRGVFLRGVTKPNGGGESTVAQFGDSFSIPPTLAEFIRKYIAGTTAIRGNQK